MAAGPGNTLKDETPQQLISNKNKESPKKVEKSKQEDKPGKSKIVDSMK
jgi:hypothetical protein